MKAEIKGVLSRILKLSMVCFQFENFKLKHCVKKVRKKNQWVSTCKDRTRSARHMGEGDVLCHWLRAAASTLQRIVLDFFWHFPIHCQVFFYSAGRRWVYRRKKWKRNNSFEQSAANSEKKRIMEANLIYCPMVGGGSLSLELKSVVFGSIRSTLKSSWRRNFVKKKFNWSRNVNIWMNFAKTIVRASTVGLVIAGSRCLRLALFERRPISTNSPVLFSFT